MALIVETGTGSATAESYESVANTTTYLTNFGDQTAWVAASTAVQEAALREATRWLEAKFATRWIGSRLTQAQALGWPRTGALDFDGYSVGYNSVPKQVRDATAILANKALTDDLLPDIAAGSGSIKSKEVHADVVGTTIVYAGVASAVKTYSIVIAMLSTLLVPLGEMERG